MFIINRANPEAQGDMFEYSEVIINRDLPSKIAKIVGPGCGYNKKFKYNIPVNNTGISYPWVVWCAENCKQRWGWWFNKKTYEACMSFEDRNESIFWCLRWVGTNK